ncbi:SRPBCC family protein [Streptomyces fragilis]|uniref:SRPBCC family protein n=1 Tax=Streptomyces fragilis TaxID=67301 RepID=A0ABV2YE42_9ACTN|nr:SRPBCC family protein [Streptomyces fragilis]
MRPSELTRYRFRGRWSLSAPPAEVYGVLERVDDYPRWWPQVREAERTGEASGRVLVRSLLPYDLRMELRAVRHEPDDGVLEAALFGDLEGWMRWTVRPAGAGTLVLHDQDTDLAKPLLRLLGVPGRPLLRANHALMMRGGRRGLEAFLTGGGEAV